MTELLRLLSMTEAELPRVMVGDETNRRYLKNAAMGLLMRCLDHTDQTVAITSVIGIAKRGCTPVNTEWTSLLCKCILKSTKTLRGASPQPNYSAVVLSCHEFLCTMPARQRKLDADAAMRFRALKLLVNELSSMDAVDLSRVPSTMDQGELGIRGLLRQLGNSVAADSSTGAAASVAAPASEKLSASGWRLPVQEVPVPADVAPSAEGCVESSEPVESVANAENAEWTELQRLVERLLEEKCEEDSTINDLRDFISKYPDTDVDAALEDGLPAAMLDLVRDGLARMTNSQLPLARTQNEVHQNEVREETGSISQTKDPVRIHILIAILCSNLPEPTRTELVCFTLHVERIARAHSCVEGVSACRSICCSCEVTSRTSLCKH